MRVALTAGLELGPEHFLFFNLFVVFLFCFFVTGPDLSIVESSNPNARECSSGSPWKFAIIFFIIIGGRSLYYVINFGGLVGPHPPI